MRDPTTLYNIIHPEDRPMLIAKEKEAYMKTGRTLMLK